MYTVADFIGMYFYYEKTERYSFGNKEHVMSVPKNNSSVFSLMSPEGRRQRVSELKEQEI